ncbi:MAG: polysaccharide biosynthesis tyrosine autokinase, partial [Solirubrobacteraceae bacterium]|nr:polysaccharide biosynthesis tyrosine autokinase [Patulibacter sp.]
MTEPAVDPWASETRADIAAQRLLKRVLRQWWLVALCAIVAGAAAYFASSSQTKQYEATSTIEIGSADLVSAFLSDSVQVSDQDPDRIKAGAVASFSLPNVRDRAVNLLQGRVSSIDLNNRVTVDSVPDSGVVKVVAKDPDPSLARNMSNAMVNAFIAQRISLARNQVINAKNQITQQFNNLSKSDKTSQPGQALQQRLKQVGVLGAVQDGNVTVIQGARTPSEPSSPRPKRDTALGLIAGLLLGLGVAVLRARLDDRIRDTEELGEIWDLPIVGLVPQTGTLKESGRRVPEPSALEALSLARTNLRYLHVGGSIKTVVVTSALEAEGKSTLAWNLAIAASLASSKVIVVEADLRRPKLTGRLNLGGDGLSEVLAGLAQLDDAITSVDVAGDDGSTATTVDVLPAGLVPPSPVALLENPTTKTTLATLRERYDIVIIDTPPATIVADAVALVDEVDGVIIVSRLGTVRRGAIKRLREILTG